MAMASASGKTGTPSSRVRATIGVKARSFFLPAAASALASAATRDGSPHGLGQHDRFGLDGGKRRRGVRPTDFDDREGAFGAQCRNDIHGRAIGNDDKRTLQRHVQIQDGRMQD